MLTVDKMKELGCNTAEGLGRCLNNEMFYLNLVQMGLKDENFAKLEEVLKTNDLEKGFEVAKNFPLPETAKITSATLARCNPYNEVVKVEIS